ncbi:hypothetical protein ACK8HX_05000 [Oryzobacter sp. R7]|uniref:hypothetical protein n=1 Tax=Oryzobacter faecalis TaxID=3388656 RepID=UPI00398CE673
MAATSPRRVPTSRWPRALGGLVVAGVVGLLALAPVSAVVASNLPQPIVAAPSDPRVGDVRPTSRIRAVPVGLPEAAVVRTLEDVRPIATAALGAEAADEILAVVADPDVSVAGAGPDPSVWSYPYRFPRADAVVERADPEALAAHGGELGAALMVVAADPAAPYAVPEDAARLAFAVLDAARGDGACDPQLDLLTLVASGPEIGPEIVDSETRRTQLACPGDPTPGWLAVQRALNEMSGEDDLTRLVEFDVDRLATARRWAEDLVARFPDDPGAVAALGDVHLTRGRYLAVPQPFSSRHAYDDARGLFARIRATGDRLAGGLGLARAELGLGRAAEAARLALEVAQGQSRPGRALQVAVRAEERDRRFARAAATASRLADLGPAALPVDGSFIPIAHPLTWGADRMRPVAFYILAAGMGGGGLVGDEGFVPRYRPTAGITDEAEFCPQWSARRAAWLAGDENVAAEGWPDDFDAIAPSDFGGTCPDPEPLKRLIDNPDPAAQALGL